MYNLLQAFVTLINNEMGEDIQVDSCVALANANIHYIKLTHSGLFPVGVTLEVTGDDELTYGVAVLMQMNLPDQEQVEAMEVSEKLSALIRRTDYLELE